ALVLLDVVLRCVMWSVVGARAEPEVPRLVVARLLGVTNEADRLIGDVLREVIPILGHVGLLDEMVVLDQLAIPLIGFAADETVEAVVTQPEWPVLAIGTDVERIDRHIVVLADPQGGPASIAQHRRDRGVFRRNVTRIAREPGRRFGNRA